MFLKVFYIVTFLMQYRFGFEIEEYEYDVPYEILSSEEYDENLMTTLDSNENDHDNFIGSEELLDDVSSKESSAEESEDSVILTGPVKAKGTVSVAANFGYDSPGSANYPSFFTTTPMWFPLAFFPPYFFPTSLFASPIPPTFSHVPLISTFLPELVVSENALDSKSEVKVKPARKDIFLEITPVKDVEDIPASNPNPSVESLSLDSLENPDKFLDEDFTDYDGVEEEHKKPVKDEVKLKESKSADNGVIYGGFVPASGTVKIAARF